MNLIDTEAKLVAIEQRAASATGGKWWWYREAGLLLGLKATRISPWRWLITWKGPDAPREGLDVSPEDQAFIAHSREDVPDLCATIRQLRTALRKIHATLSPSQKGYISIIDEVLK